MGNACGCIENKEIHLQDDQKEMNNAQRGAVHADIKAAKQKSEPMNSKPDESSQNGKKDVNSKQKSKEESISHQADTKIGSSKPAVKPEEVQTKPSPATNSKPAASVQPGNLNSRSESHGNPEQKSPENAQASKAKTQSQGVLNPIPVPTSPTTNITPGTGGTTGEKPAAQSGAGQKADGKSKEDLPKPAATQSAFAGTGVPIGQGAASKPKPEVDEMKRLAGSLGPTNPTVVSLLKKHGVYEPLTYISADDFTKQAGVRGGAVFEGELKQMSGSKQGLGRMLFPNGSLVEGYFVDFVLEGEGRIIKPNGEVYFGHFKDGKAMGRGKYVKNTGEEYSGEFMNDKPNGSGTMKYVNGDLYSGEFVNGVREGRGVLNLASGDRYEGVFSKGLFHGRYFWKVEEMKYDGEWKEGHMDGLGKFFWKDGNLYEGGYKAGLKHGRGTLTVVGGPKYEGEWKEGKQHGQGKLISQSGEVLADGRWEAGEFVG